MLEHADLIISGRYRLLQLLRRGGMSEVFLALDEQTQQQVAIKLITSDDPDCMKRFQREVCILRKLSHEHILPLLDDGIAGRYYYLVMPYMQRGNLRERLVRGKMMQEEAAVILHQLAGALEYVHKRGIVHRDIKPSNVLLDNSDASRVYLADFGLAKALEEKSDITQTGCLIGTPEYMAPELADKPESVRSDVYALGVLLYQMLTGRLPFTGSSPLITYWKHIKEQPTLPSALNAEISQAVEDVIMRALDKDPQLRFPGAQAMALAYANALSATDQLHTLPAISMHPLPQAQVTLHKVEAGLIPVIPGSFWQKQVGKAVQKGMLGLAAIVLLGLPVSLGFILARDSSHVNPALGIGAVSVDRVVPSTQITSSIKGAAFPPDNASSPQVVPQQTIIATLKDKPSPPDGNGGKGHDHGHGHGHGHDN